ncbi:uncharacterized protein LOC132311425 [Cornus florida]|uniref:uncharacterized protein LOC132311425 n=1 Tax=Cornus florida TaxID=4283 RepID=UPI00289A8897|nr:uncharacterized protein LOC132311425 [Cornus florida]XP_059665312.1 uncharacterized protein LOC132311425 [Cornus florida]
MAGPSRRKRVTQSTQYLVYNNVVGRRSRSIHRQPQFNLAEFIEARQRFEQLEEQLHAMREHMQQQFHAMREQAQIHQAQIQEQKRSISSLQSQLTTLTLLVEKHLATQTPSPGATHLT